MSSPKPPALASWMVEHLVIGPNRDAVAGDLLEQFARRPSAGWYWRQVLAAIGASLWKERRILWLAAAGTVIWRMVLDQFWWRIWSFKETSALSFAAYPLLPWPMSDPNTVAFNSILNGLPLLVVLPLYLAAARNFSLSRISRGLMVGILALPLSVIPALMFQSAVWSFVRTVPLVVLRAEYGWVLPLLRAFNQTTNALPLFVALLLSLWAARTCRQHSEVLPAAKGELA